MAVLGAGGLAAIIPKVVDGIRAWQSGKADEEKAANRSALGRLVIAERERDEEATFRRQIEDWAARLHYLLIQMGVPEDKLPARPERKRV